MKNVFTTLAVSSVLTTALFAEPYQGSDGKWYESFTYTGDQTIPVLNNWVGDKKENPREIYEFSVAEGQSTATVSVDGTVRGYDFTVNSGVSITGAKNVTNTGNGNLLIDHSLTIASGASLTTGKNEGLFSGSATWAAGGGRLAGTINIQGALTVNGYRWNPAKQNAWDGDNYLLAIQGKTTISGAGASLTQIGVHSAETVATRAINKLMSELKIDKNVREKAVQFDDYLFFRGGTLILDSEGVVVSGVARGATSQADSTFYMTGAANTLNVINANVANEIGTLMVQDGTRVKLVSELLGTEGDAFVINELQAINSSMGEMTGANITLMLNFGYTNPNTKSMRIVNIEEFMADNNITVQVYNGKEYVAGVLGENYYILDGGWVSAVPEPAEWAAIFGAVALAFVAYRKRKA